LISGAEIAQDLSLQRYFFGGTTMAQRLLLTDKS